MKQKIKILAPIFLLFAIAGIYAMGTGGKQNFTIPTLDNKVYAELKKTNKPIAIAFNAKWCPTCMTQHKALDSLLPEYKGKIAIYAYDWDEIDSFDGPKVKQRTTIAIIKKDKIIDELIGETRKEKIAEFLDKNIGK